jgi:hypothetical protein
MLWSDMFYMFLFIVHLTMVSVVLNIYRQILGLLIMSWEDMQGCVCVTRFQVGKSQNLPGGSEETHERPQSRQPVFRPRFESAFSRDTRQEC